jgi:transposase
MNWVPTKEKREKKKGKDDDVEAEVRRRTRQLKAGQQTERNEWRWEPEDVVSCEPDVRSSVIQFH